MDSAQVMPIDTLAREAAMDDTRDVSSLVREHSTLVFRIAYSVLRNRQDAEDAAQEVFIRVLRQEKRLGEIEDVKSWIARIAWRLAIKRKPSRPEISLDEAAVAVVHGKAAGQSAEEIAAGNQMSALLAHSMASLPKAMRDTLTLSAVHELSARDVAKVLGVPESTVRTRTFRARQLLREKLEKRLGGNYGK
jgi:RNA polymerase sigma-70 factor (ECF subfamily)